MRLTVGPLPATVYWRRRAVVAAALALVVIVFAATCAGSEPPSPPGRPGSAGAGSVDAGQAPTPGPDGWSSPSSTFPGGAENSPGQSFPGQATPGDGTPGGAAQPGPGEEGVEPPQPPVTATVPCSDDEISLAAAVSPSPGIYGGVLTLTLIVRNTADHACLRDVGSGPQELQVRRGDTLIWSSDHCGTPQAPDQRAFGPNIESRFSLRWYTYRIAPDDCALSPTPAAPGNYTVVARLDNKFSTPLAFEIEK